MKPIGGARALVAAQVGIRRDIKAMFADMSARLAGQVTRVSDQDGRIPQSTERRLMAAVGDTVSSYFVGVDGRSPFAEDGVTALAAYPRVLNTWIARVTRDVVYAQRNWMRRNVPEDIQAWLRLHRRRLREIDPVFMRLVRSLRIFSENPLAQYESAHTWVDANGYRLSDRIWQASLRTRAKIDAMLTDGIRQGRGAFQLAKDLEKFLLPDRLGRRTNRPYGRDASLDAMRLARTEITHAHSQATLAAGRANPYVDGMDWALSARHPKFDVCDRIATIGMAGQRLREPYPLNGAQVPPAHPHCLCIARTAASATPERVTEQLRAAIAQANFDPYLTPLTGDDFVRDLLGDALMLLLAGATARRIFSEVSHA
jgi:hypothetical protein